MAKGRRPVATPPPANPNKTMLRNILTGVITSVLGATIIYFLGFHNKGGNSSEASLLVTKENTLRAWQSYVAGENMLNSNWNTYVANYSNLGFEQYKKNTLAELERFRTDLEKIAEQKSIDPSLLSLLKRRIAAMQEWEEKYRQHLDNYERLNNGNAPEPEKNRQLGSEVQRFVGEIRLIDLRFNNEIAEVCTSLSSKYAAAFSPADLKMYRQPVTNNNNNNTTGMAAVDRQQLVGQWQTKADGVVIGNLYQNNDGSMYYYFVSGDSTYGRWQLNNNQLTLYYDQHWGAGKTLVYNVTAASTQSFTMVFAQSPYNTIQAARLP